MRVIGGRRRRGVAIGEAPTAIGTRSVDGVAGGPASAARIDNVAVHSFALSGLTLVASAITGVIIARALGVAGRGDLTALQMGPLVGVSIFSLGASQSVAFFSSRHPGQRRSVVGNWLFFAAPLTAACILVTEVALPALLGGQSSWVLDTARVFAPPMIALGIYAEVGWGALLGTHDYRYFNVAHAAAPVILAITYPVLWRLGSLQTGTALIAFGAAYGGVAAVVLARGIRRTAVKQSDEKAARQVARDSLLYGIRAHGMNLGSLVGARLDLLLLPAFTAASNVGLYSVATNISWLVVGVTSSLASLVLPAAAAEGGDGSPAVLRAVRITLLVALAFAVLLAVCSGWALPVAYGNQFRAASNALELLLPGSVVIAGAAVLNSGLCAANRPGRAALAQLPGLVTTSVGLPLFLPIGGVTAAAGVSTAAYGATFVASVILYRRVTYFRMRQLCPTSNEFALLIAPLARGSTRVRAIFNRQP